MSKVVKSASKVAKRGRGPTLDHPVTFRPAGLFLVFVDQFSRTFKRFFCTIHVFQSNFMMFSEFFINFQQNCTIVHENLAKCLKMRKGMSKVVKSASKVAKRGSSCAHFGHPGSLLRPAESFLAFVDRCLRTLKRFCCRVRVLQCNFMIFSEVFVNFL